MTVNTLAGGAEPQSKTQSTLWTAEGLVYALIGLAAAALRLLNLGALPLTPNEAATAWAAWLDAAAHTAPDVAAPASALLYTLHRLTFGLFGGGDALARLFPALVGLGMVLLPWLLRRRMGRVPALIAAGLIAVDPWLITASRQADSTILSIGLGLLLLAGLAKLADEGAWSPALAVAAGLFVISGPGAWGLLPVIVVAGTLFFKAKKTELALLWTRQNLGLLLASAILGATVWLLRPAGLAAVGTSLGAWVGHFADQGYPLAWAGLRLVRDQLWLLIFGLGGLALLWQDEDRSWAILLTAWTAWAFALLLLPGRTPADLPMLSLPLLLAAPRLMAWPWVTHWRATDRQEGMLMGGILVAIMVTGMFWFVQYANTNAPEPGFNALLSLLLAGVLVLFFGWWANWPMAGRVTVILGTALLLYFGTATGWQINTRLDPPGTLGYERTVPDLDARQLAVDIRTLSAQRVGDQFSIPLQVQVNPAQNSGPDPILGWYLREMRELKWVLSPDVIQAFDRSPLVVTPADAPPTLPDGYIGSDYRIRQSWLPSDLPDTQARLRWLLYQKAPATRTGESVDLWVALTQ